MNKPFEDWVRENGGSTGTRTGPFPKYSDDAKLVNPEFKPTPPPDKPAVTAYQSHERNAWVVRMPSGYLLADETGEPIDISPPWHGEMEFPTARHACEKFSHVARKFKEFYPT